MRNDQEPAVFRISPPAVVAGAYQTAVVLMRDLARRGVRVCCIDWLREPPGFRTVYGPAFECPNPDDDPSAWLTFMVDLARKLGGKPVLMASADQYVSAMAQHAGELEKSFRFCQSAITVQALLATKRRQYDIASLHGLPVPRTQVVNCVEKLIAFGSSAHFPCILKPFHFREWQRLPPNHPLYYAKLVLADSPEELLTKYRMASEISPELVVQEVIQGPDTAKLVYVSCYACDGRRIGNCLLRELRTTPIYFGSASIVEPISDPETDSACDLFLRSINYAGICELELKRDSRDGQVKLIEANPRYSVTADAAVYAGVVLGWLHYLDLIGEPVAPVSPNGRDFRHIVLSRDLVTIRSYRKDGLLTWGSLIRSYKPPVAFFDFDIRDWRVTARNAVTLVRKVRGAISNSLQKIRQKGPLARARST
jgi:D-aspartate ligase